MSISYSPKTSTNGLVFAFDAANIKSFDNRENLFLYSEDLTQAQWVKQNTSVTTNAILAPDGTLTADKYAGINGTTSRQAVYQNATFTSGIKYTLSVFAKQGERRYFSFWFDSPNISESAYYGAGNIIDLQTGTLASGSGPMNIVSFGNGWYRYSITATPTVSGSFALSFAIGEPNNNPPYNSTGDGTSGIYIWGAQLEKGTTSTKYIKTTESNNPRSNTINNLIGNNTNGIVTSLSYSTVNSFNFNGTSDCITIPPVLPAGQTKYTMSAWWKTNSLGNGVIYEQNSASATANQRSAIIQVGSTWGFNGQNNDAHSYVPVTSNTWINGVITVDTTSSSNPIKIYQNGVLYWQGNSSASASNLNMGASSSFIGKKVSNSEYFSGEISNVSVYNRVLSEKEVQENFQALRSRYGI